MKGNLLFFACFFILMVSCRRDMDCPEDDSYRYPFVEGDTNILVYAIHDTITFVDQNFDEITFVCVDKTYWPYSTGGYDGSGLDCGHNTYYVFDRIEFVFKPYGNSHKFVSYVTKTNDKNPTPLTTMFLDDHLIFNFKVNESTYYYYNDSIIFNGSYLSGVYSIYDSIGLFNLNFGLLRFKDKNENIWELKEKK